MYSENTAGERSPLSDSMERNLQLWAAFEPELPELSKEQHCSLLESALNTTRERVICKGRTVLFDKKIQRLLATATVNEITYCSLRAEIRTAVCLESTYEMSDFESSITQLATSRCIFQLVL